MKPDSFIISILYSLPERKIIGKKRVQKFAMLLQEAGLEIDVGFRLHHYGPYSDGIAAAVDELSLTGVIDENDTQIGLQGMFASVFTLPESVVNDVHISSLPNRYPELLICLNGYSTIELEVASTIRFFAKSGSNLEEAIDKTKSMKPTKTADVVLKKADEILELVDNYL